MDDEDFKKFLHDVSMRAGRPAYTDKFGRPLTLLEWAQLMEDAEYKRVACNELPATTINPSSRLSTVWLGLDHNFWPQGPPLTFETMRFSLEGKDCEVFIGRTYFPSLEFPDPDDRNQTTDQVRWSTEEAARLGHGLILRLIQELEMQ